MYNLKNDGVTGIVLERIDLFEFLDDFVDDNIANIAKRRKLADLDLEAEDLSKVLIALNTFTNPDWEGIDYKKCKGFCELEIGMRYHLYLKCHCPHMYETLEEESYKQIADGNPKPIKYKIFFPTRKRKDFLKD